MMETFNKFVLFLSQLGSARRSPTAGPVILLALTQ